MISSSVRIVICYGGEQVVVRIVAAAGGPINETIDRPILFEIDQIPSGVTRVRPSKIS